MFNVQSFKYDTSTFYFFAVDCDATVGADNGTRGTAGARILVVLFNVAVTTAVDHLIGQLDDVHGACHDAEAATLAAFCVDFNGAFHFCHSAFFLWVVKVLAVEFHDVHEHLACCSGW